MSKVSRQKKKPKTKLYERAQIIELAYILVEGIENMMKQTGCNDERIIPFVKETPEIMNAAEEIKKFFGGDYAKMDSFFGGLNYMQWVYEATDVSNYIKYFCTMPSDNIIRELRK